MSKQEAIAAEAIVAVEAVVRENKPPCAVIAGIPVISDHRMPEAAFALVGAHNTVVKVLDA